MSKIRAHLGLALLLAIFFALGAIYLQVTPPLETPDEPSHFSVVKYVADEGRLPPARPAPADGAPVPTIEPGPPVYYAPPLYYLLGAFLIRDLDTDGFAEAVVPNPNWVRGWAPTPGPTPENKHVYVYTTAQRTRVAGWAQALLRLRVFSLLLGGVTVAGVYGLARMLWLPASAHGTRFSGQGWVLATTALVAFNPSFLFVTIGVTNDSLLIALTTWAFVVMTGFVSNDRAGSTFRIVLAGALLGLAALTKQSALAFLPVGAVAVLWSARLQPQPWRAGLKRLLLWALPLVLLAGWWYARNTLMYADPLGFKPHQTPTGEWAPSLQLLFSQLGQALQGYWAAFGWGLLFVEPVIYLGIGAFLLISGAGWWRRLLRDRDQGTAAQDRMTVLLGLGVWLNLIGLMLWLWRTSAPYGRLLFPTMGSLAALLVLGWEAWLGRRWDKAFAGLVVLVWGAFAALVPLRYLRPAYADPVVPAAAVKEATPLDVRFAAGDGDLAGNEASLILLGYRMAPLVAEPGEQVTLSLYWRSTKRVTEPLNVFVQLAPQDPRQRVASQDDYLGTSHYPTHVWQPGETVRQVHALSLPVETPAPMVYWFSVGLYGDDKARLPVVVDGTPIPEDAVRLGPLVVTGAPNQKPRHTVDFYFGSSIALDGYELSPRSDQEPPVVATGAVTVTLYWRAVAAPRENLTVFVHLLDANGELVTQDDGPPRAGGYPTWAWRKGDQIPDAHVLAVPLGLEDGTYRIQVGLYRAADGIRVPAYDAAGQRLSDDVAVLLDVYRPTGGERSGG